MPYRYPDNIPAVAKNWTKPQQRKCIAAANAVLSSGKSEREAIFACIHAAGKTRQKQGPDEYEQASEKASKTFQKLVALYFAGKITLSVFRQRFSDELERHFVVLMLLGLGKQQPTDADYARLNDMLQKEMVYFDNFILQLEADEVSEARASFRAGLYGYTRHVYIAFTIPDFVALGMPVLPGEDCLGGDLCGCWLEVVGEDEEYVYVDWNLDPAKENCEVCISHALEWNPIAIAK